MQAKWDVKNEYQINEIKSKLKSVEKLVRNNTLNSSNKSSNQMLNSITKTNSCKFIFNTSNKCFFIGKPF